MPRISRFPTVPACADLVPKFVWGWTTGLERWRMRRRQSFSIATIPRQRPCWASCCWNTAGRKDARPALGEPGRDCADPADPRSPVPGSCAGGRWRHRRRPRDARDWYCIGSDARGPAQRGDPACDPTPRLRRRIRLAEEARVAGVTDACTFGLMGHALSSLGRHAEAADAYAEALKLGPEILMFAISWRPRASCQRTACAGRLSAGGVRWLCRALRDPPDCSRLSGPRPDPCSARRASMHHTGERLGPVLDLGCGTGLSPSVFSDLPDRPVDRRRCVARMLAGRGGEAALRRAARDGPDAVPGRGRDTALAAHRGGDVLAYFGALAEVMAAVHSRPRAGRLVRLLGRGIASRPPRCGARATATGRSTARPLRAQHATM